MKLKWYWRFLIWRLYLLIIHHISNSTHWWRPCSWWNSLVSKAVFEDTMCPNYFGPQQWEAMRERDTVLQMGAKERYRFIRGGSSLMAPTEWAWKVLHTQVAGATRLFGSDIWFIHSSWPFGTKNNLFSSSRAWLSHWPHKWYNWTITTSTIYVGWS